MLKLTVYNQSGKDVKEIELNESIFGIEPHKQAMFDMVLLQRASMRQGTHKTKARGEVRGGGKKPWRQKGTGRARQGSIRSPQWVGGGVVFGPSPRSYAYKLNRKVKRLALRSALSSKVVDSNLTILDTLTIASPRTKSMVEVMNNLKLSGKTMVVIVEEDMNTFLSARNIPGLSIMTVSQMNVLDILNHGNLVMTEGAVKAIEEVLV